MATIAIFDSGVGGLTIYQAVREQLPEEDLIFVSDNQAFPYGTKDESELKVRVLKIAERIVRQFDPDILIVACNTASTVVLPDLRERYVIPIVGVVPAIKPAAELSKSKQIGLLATPATIEREYTEQLIQDFAQDCKVTRIGSSRLVEIAEDKLSGKQINLSEIQEVVQPILDNHKIDVLVLACTHFPLLKDEIRQVLETENRQVKLLDSAQGIANRATELLDEVDMSEGQSIAVFSKLDEVDDSLIQQLSEIGFDSKIGLK